MINFALIISFSIFQQFNTIEDNTDSTELVFTIDGMAIKYNSSVSELADGGYSQKYLNDSSFIIVCNCIKDIKVCHVFANLYGGIPLGVVLKMKNKNIEDRLGYKSSEILYQNGLGPLNKMEFNLEDLHKSDSLEIYTIYYKNFDYSLIDTILSGKHERLNVDSVLQRYK